LFAVTETTKNKLETKETVTLNAVLGRKHPDSEERDSKIFCSNEGNDSVAIYLSKSKELTSSLSV